jgi:hypothetical protein
MLQSLPPDEEESAAATAIGPTATFATSVKTASADLQRLTTIDPGGSVTAQREFSNIMLHLTM